MGLVLEYIIDVEAGNDYEPPVREYPAVVYFANDESYPMRVLPVEDYNGFSIGDKVKLGYIRATIKYFASIEFHDTYHSAEYGTEVVIVNNCGYLTLSEIEHDSA